MPTVPTPENDFTVGLDTPLNPATFNAIFSNLSTRLKAAEAVAAGIDTALADLAATAIAVVSDTISPQIAALQTLLDGLNAQIAEAEDTIAELVGGGVPGTNISFVPGVGSTIAATNVTAAINELESDLKALITALGTLVGEVSDAVDAVSSTVGTHTTEIAALQTGVSNAATKGGALALAIALG